MNKNLIRTGIILAAAGAGFAMTMRSVNRNRNKIDFSDKTIVISGGSRGLGFVLAQQYGREGARIALLSRNEDDLKKSVKELEETGIEATYEVCDVRNRQQVEQALGAIVRKYGRLDVLVNNAGIIQVGPVEHMRLEDYEDAMDVHFWGPLYCIMTALHYMRQQGGGRIINITSIGGKVAVPHLAPYTASKFALVGLSDALRSELAQEGIYVTTVAPGLMRTGSYYNALFKGEREEEFTWFSVLSALPVTSTDVENAASQIVEATRFGETDLIITPQARILAVTDRLFPRFTANIMKVFNRFLPEPAEKYKDIPKAGWEIHSEAAPSKLTRLGDERAEDTGQLRGQAPAV
jgi:NAD(P)-dependent dehydrogenase (short-subunit alcohol dehydrogenase family)